MCPVWVLTKDKYTLYILRMSAPPVFSWFIMKSEINSGAPEWWEVLAPLYN
jgi:hypothetical protein